MRLDISLMGASAAKKTWKRLVVSGLLLAGSASGCTTAEEPADEDEQVEESDGDDVDAVKDAGKGPKKDASTTKPSDDEDDVLDDDDDSEPPTGGKDAGSPSRDAGRTDAGKDGGTTTPAKDGGSAGGSSLWCNVKAITDKSCVTCHDGKGTGGSPFGLVTPADFVAESKSVSARIHDKANPMPPRGLLPEADLKLIDQWLAAGAPAGDDATCKGSSPTKPSTGGGNDVDGWDPSKCDQIYEIRSHGPGGANEPYTVPVGAEIHPQVRIDAPWGDEKVQAIAFRPITDNQKVLHHWILNATPRTFLVGWAPGDEARPPFPLDVGMDMPSGKGSMVLDMHYYNTKGTKPEADRSGVEVCVLKQKNFRPKTAAVATSLASIGAGGILAPRGAQDKPTTGTCNVTAKQPVHLLTAAPHAHTYATHMKFVVKKKNGQEIVMHDQPFKCGEQGTYPLPGGEVIVETGDTITTTCVYTNNTNKDIRFGESTESEMCFNFALYYPKGALSCGGGLLGGLFGGQ